VGEARTTVVVGGTSGIGLEVARHFAAGGDRVIISGRDLDRASRVAAGLDGDVTAIAFDLSDPATIGPALAGVDEVHRLVIAAIERDANTVRTYDTDRALHLITLKLVGYAEVVHQLVPRMTTDASIVLFGGVAFERPYPGSITVSTVNGGVTGLTHALVAELAPMRVNAVHPGVIGDSPAVINGWTADAKAAVTGRTPIGRLVGMQEVVDAVVFLLANTGVNGVNLVVDGGWLLR
jgi:NAD(P)-dependent dehydrogenase (short-subunit alcohol dehydrogenase family)